MSTLDTILQQIAARVERPVVTIGNFDGVHLGHRAIVAEVQASAARRGAPSVALTFEPHPVIFFGKRTAEEFRITDPDQKLALLRRCGIDHPAALPFGRELASHSPEDFVRRVLHEALGACEVWVGYDFNFGKGRAGGTEDLRRHGRALGIDVHVHEAVSQGAEVISSTRVRKALSEGQLDEVARLLGRPHGLCGVVEHGEGRGRTLGFPTANILPTAGLMIPRGVYLTEVAMLDDDGEAQEVLPGITNVGVRPTVTDGAVATNAESFIMAGLPVDADLYGRRVEVRLHRFVRPERRFESLDALKAQVGADIEQARAFHKLS